MKTYDIQEISSLKIHGRTIEDASPLPLFWTHSGIEVNCTGSELWVDVETDCSTHEAWVAYEINGAFMGRMMLLPGTHSLCLYRSMVPGVVKNVKFYRELQAMSEDPKCWLVVKSLKTDGDFLPVDEPKLKLEFIGDSITSGEGTYGALEDTEWLAMYMSSSRTYATMLEKALKADARVVSQGGWGVCVSWDNNPLHCIPRVYEPVCGLAAGEVNEKLGAGRPYDFSSWQPDCIIINLGTNDDTSFKQPGQDVPGLGYCKMRMDEATGVRDPEDEKKVFEAIVDFLGMLRKDNPGAHLLWAYGMLGRDLEPVIKGAITEYTKRTGDMNVAYLLLPDTTEKTVGSHSHPGYASHKAASRVLGRYLSERFNTELHESEEYL